MFFVGEVFSWDGVVRFAVFMLSLFCQYDVSLIMLLTFVICNGKGKPQVYRKVYS